MESRNRSEIQKKSKKKMHLLPDTRRRVVIYLVYQNLLGVPSTWLRDAVGLLVMPGFQLCG